MLQARDKNLFPDSKFFSCSVAGLLTYFNGFHLQVVCSDKISMKAVTLPECEEVCSIIRV